MTFFKVLHRALPTNTRFHGDQRCRLGCGCRERFTHWGHRCRILRNYWQAVTATMNTLNCGRYRPTNALVFFTLKWVEGRPTVVNRHARGIIWLAWKFLWQQLAAIEPGSRGRFSIRLAMHGLWSMHHTAVLGALYDYNLAELDKMAGARNRCHGEQESAEKFRVWPFVQIRDAALSSGAGTPALRYTKAYYRILLEHDITPSPDIREPE